MKIKIFYDGKSPAKVVDPEGREIEGVCHVVLQLQTGSEPHCVITIKNPAVKFTGEAKIKQQSNSPLTHLELLICEVCGTFPVYTEAYQLGREVWQLICVNCGTHQAIGKVIKMWEPDIPAHAVQTVKSGKQVEPPKELNPWRNNEPAPIIPDNAARPGVILIQSQLSKQGRRFLKSFIEDLANMEETSPKDFLEACCTDQYFVTVDPSGSYILFNPVEEAGRFVTATGPETYGAPQHGKAAALQAIRVPKLEESFICICAKCASKRGDFSEWRKRPAVWHGECQECKQMATVKNAPLLKFEEAKPGVRRNIPGINPPVPEPAPVPSAPRYSYFMDGEEVKIAFVHTTGIAMRDLLPDAKRGYAIFMESTDIEEKDRQILDDTLIAVDHPLPKRFYTVPPASCGVSEQEPANWMCSGEGCLKQKANAPEEVWTLMRLPEQHETARQNLRFCLTCWRRINALIAF